MLSLNDTQLVKRLKLGRNCGEIGHDILPECMVFEWLISG